MADGWEYYESFGPPVVVAAPVEIDTRIAGEHLPGCDCEVQNGAAYATKTKHGPECPVETTWWRRRAQALNAYHCPVWFVSW